MSETEESTKKRVQVRIPSADLESFLTEAAGALGMRAANYEPKSHSSGASPEPLCTDEQLGWGRWQGHGTVAKFRRLARAWSLMDRLHQDVAGAYYTTDRLPPGVEQNIWGAQSMSHEHRMSRVLFVLECRPLEFDKKTGKPKWSKADLALGDEALHVAHEDWETARAKVAPAKARQSRTERVTEELGL